MLAEIAKSLAAELAEKFPDFWWGSASLEGFDPSDILLGAKIALDPKVYEWCLDGATLSIDESSWGMQVLKDLVFRILFGPDHMVLVAYVDRAGNGGLSPVIKIVWYYDEKLLEKVVNFAGAAFGLREQGKCAIGSSG